MPALLAIESLESDKSYVERQLAQMPDSRWGTARLMWENRLEEIQRRISELSSQRSSFASVALIFDGVPVIGSSDIRLDFTTEALDSYQKVVTLALAAKLSDEMPKRGPLPGAQQSRLFIRDIVHGSMGFILEEIGLEQTPLFPTPLKESVEGATRLLGSLSGSSDDDFELLLESTQPRLLYAVQRFAQVLYGAGASTKILGDDQKLVLSTDAVGALSRRLNEVTVEEELLPEDGVLQGVLPDARQFELKIAGDDGYVVKGMISEELALKYTADPVFKDRLLLRPVRAQLKHVRTRRNGRLVKEQLVLEAVEPL